MLEDVNHFARENIKDIIACGFDIDRTFIFTDTSYIYYLYPNFIKMQKNVSLNQVLSLFGLGGSDNVGKIAYPSLQSVPAFSNTFPHIFGDNTEIPCLIPEAIDQDPYFRLTRDIAPKLGYLKPAVLHAKLFPALSGLHTKMSACEKCPAIYFKDAPAEIEFKINNFAFSGGGKNLQDHKEKEENLEVDVSYQYLQFLMEDDEKLNLIRQAYAQGQMTTGDVKKELINLLVNITSKHQMSRSQVTDEIISEFMRPRPLLL